MSLDRIAFALFDNVGNPRADATPLFTIFRSRALFDRTPPTGSLATPIPLLGGNVYGCTASAADVAEATAYLIDAGPGCFFASGARYGFGSVCPENAPWFVQAFFDGAGSLYAGAVAPTIDVWSTFAAVDTAPHPTPLVIASPYFWGFSPSNDALRTGHAFRWAPPTSAFPTGAHGVAFFASPQAGATVIELIRAELLASPSVTDLVEERIFPMLSPQGMDSDHVVLRVISGVPENTLDGTATGRLSGSRLQVDCYSKTYLGAHAVFEVCDAVISALVGSALSARQLSTRDDYDDESKLFCASGDFTVWR